MKFKIDKDMAKNLMAIGAGLALGTELWYLDFKARMQDERSAVVNKEIENMLLLMKFMDDDIRDLQDKVNLISYVPEEESKTDLFGNLK